VIEVKIDRARMLGQINLVGVGERTLTPEEGAELLAGRLSREDLAPHPALPDDTRLWAALQQLGGGTWGGCVYDTEAILATIGKRP